MVRACAHIVWTLALVVLLTPSTSAQSRQAAQVDVSELMTAREFTAAGLQKLTPSELAALNAWLLKYANAVLQVGGAAQPAPSRGSTPATPEGIESQIDDEFEGWEGDTIFQLRNGQIWQQASYAYTYHYAYAPKVLIYKSGGVYKMKVDGVRDEITVRRIK